MDTNIIIFERKGSVGLHTQAHFVWLYVIEIVQLVGDKRFYCSPQYLDHL